MVSKTTPVRGVFVALYLALGLFPMATNAFSVQTTTKESSYWFSQGAKEVTPKSILSKIQKEPWRGGLEPAAEVISPQECQVIQGSIPNDLCGTLFRNGPGRIRIGESVYSHWFDGDGYVAKLTFQQDGDDKNNNKVFFQGSYVKTEKFNMEVGNDGRDGTNARGAWTDAKNGRWWANLFKKPTNPCNTACRMITSKEGKKILLALAEGGPPMKMDPISLDTLGSYDYGAPAEFGEVDGMASAHPSECHTTGEMYTIGLRIGVPTAWPSLTELKVFKFVPVGDNDSTAANGSLKLDCVATIDMPTINFVHDLAISENHVCIFIPPYEADGSDLLESTVSTSPLGMRFRWDDSKRTRVVVLKRSDLSIVADVTTDEPLSLYHIVNAVDLEDGGLVEIQVAAHNEGREQLEDVFKNLYDKKFTSAEQCRLRCVTVKDGKAKLQDVGPSGASPFELPAIHPSFVAKENQQVYTNAMYPDTAGKLNCIERLDLNTNEVDQAHFGPYRYAEEPILVPKSGGDRYDETNAYVLTLVYDTIEHATDCVVLDAANLSGGPIATVRLPSPITYGFHGMWTDETFL